MRAVSSMLGVALALSVAGQSVALPPLGKPVPRRQVPYSDAAVRSAVEKSLPLLWKAIEGHTAERSCFTCHNHGVPLLAFAAAREHGFAVPAERLQAQVDFVAEYLEGNRPRFIKGNGPGPSPSGGEADTTGWALFALDAVGKKPDATTAAAVEYTLARHKERDHWDTSGKRPPSEQSSFTTTSLALRALRSYGSPAQKEAIEKRITAARGWLIKAPAMDNEDRVFRLLGLKAAGASDDEVRKANKDLAEKQRKDGGWAQTDAMSSDAYATGSALVMLHQIGGLATDDPAYRRGLEFLLSDQRDDGSWRIHSRSKPFQKYFESGFPHGKDQFISCAASAWATTALALSCPKRK